jgi:hypothetical protein
MERRIIDCLFTLALMASVKALLPAPSFAESAQDVDCSTIDLKYDGPATTTKCMALDRFGNQTETKFQRLVAESSSYEMIVTYSAAKFHAYLPIRSLQQQVDDAGYFGDTDNWQPTQKFGGFDIAVFEGFAKAGDKPVLCAAFSRYGGNPGNYEFDGGPGFKNLAEGLYCAFSGQSALISPVDNFYRLIEDVIGKLHWPQ